MWERRWNDYNLFKVKRFELGSPSRVNQYQDQQLNEKLKPKF